MLFSINKTNIIALPLFIPACLVIKYVWLMFIFPLRLLFALYSLLGNIISPLEMYLWLIQQFWPRRNNLATQFCYIKPVVCAKDGNEHCRFFKVSWSELMSSVCVLLVVGKMLIFPAVVQAFYENWCCFPKLDMN